MVWTPDAQRIVTGGFDGTVRVWNVETGEQLAIQEGYQTFLQSVTISPDGRLIALNTVNQLNLWSLDTYEPITQLDIPTIASFYALDFHPSRSLLAVISDQGHRIQILALDIDRLLNVPSATAHVRYANAKVVLAGDTGVGKSGLANRLVDGEFAPTASTHARRVLTFHTETVADPATPGRHLTRETLLWDLAGQPGYRLIHQLSLDDAAVALVLFDARSEIDPFGAATYWAKALDQARSHAPIQQLLVAARTDRGGVGVSAERIAQFRREYEFENFFRTSALTGEGCDDLRIAILEAIDWDRLPIISSTQLLLDLRTFVGAWKLDEQRLLLTASALYDTYREQGEPPSWEQFASCLRRLHQADVLTLLEYGAAHQNPSRQVDVLLQPTAIDAYASAITIAARDEPDGLGHLPESDVLQGTFRLEAEERLGDTDNERKVLATVVEQFLERDIALRERINGVDYLVFPSQYTREAPFPGSTSYGLRYDFEGPVESIFATLVVRLAHHTGFKERRFFRNAASYDAIDGGRCIILFEMRDDGLGRVSVFFEADAPEAVQHMFLQYVYEHLLRKAVPGSIKRRRAYHCPNCNYLFDNDIVESRLDRGADHIICSNCDVQALLYDLMLHETETPQEATSHIDADAREAMSRQLAVTAIQGKKRANRYDTLLSYASVDAPQVLWLAESLQALGLRPWLDLWEVRPDQVQPAIPGDFQTRLVHVGSAVICMSGASKSPWQSEAQHQALIQHAQDGHLVAVALLPRADRIAKRKPSAPKFVDREHILDLRSLTPDDSQPLLSLVTLILGRNDEDPRLSEQVRNAVRRQHQDTNERRALAAAHPDAQVDVQLVFSEDVDSMASTSAYDGLRAQIAEVIGMPSEFVAHHKASKTLPEASLRFANPEDALRLFAMVRTGDAFMTELFQHWSIDIERFQQVNRETSERLRQAEVEPDMEPEPIETSPLRLIRLELKHFRCFPYLRLELDPSSTSTLDGHWTCLAGINGSGKTAILQAISLALLGHPTTHELGEGLLARTRRLENGHHMDAEINLWCRDDQGDQYVSLRVSENGTTSEHYDRGMRAFWDRVRSSVVLAYGATRNLSEFLDSRHHNTSEETQRQITLFDPLARLMSAETLLQSQPPDSAFTPLFKQLVAAVFGEEIQLSAQGDGMRFTVEDAPVLAVDLPDGFRSSVAWLADLCEAWCQKFPEQAENARPEDIEAIVLLDEIDLHLHPSLQRRLVPALRKALPRVQWIVTTHSPLVLSSFDRNEIIALDRREPSGVRELDRQILGWTTDAVINWLMGAESTSAALDDQIAEAEQYPDGSADRSLAELLEQSPDASEEEAQQRVEQLASRLDRLDL